MYPAGLTDNNIEFFAKDDELFMIRNSQIIPWSEFDEDIKALMLVEFQSKKNKALYNDLTDRFKEEALKQFIIICFGELDNIPDLNSEFHYENKHEFNLTSREIEFIKLVCEDLSDKEIAERMNIAYNTATTYRQNITHKLGVSSKVGIAIKALKYNIV